MRRTRNEARKGNPGLIQKPGENGNGFALHGQGVFDLVGSAQARPHFFTTKATPITASTMPAMPIGLKASPNMIQAMTAVVGGVR